MITSHLAPTPALVLPPCVLAAFAKALQECEEARQAAKLTQQAAKEERRRNEKNGEPCKRP